MKHPLMFAFAVMLLVAATTLFYLFRTSEIDNPALGVLGGA